MTPKPANVLNIVTMATTTNDYGIESCHICGKNDFTWVDKNGNKSIRSFMNHLRTHGLSFKEYYDQYIKTGDEGICKLDGCDNPTKWKSGQYQDFCSNLCAQNDEDKKLIIKNRFVGDPEKKEQWYIKRKRSAEKRGEWGNISKAKETWSETAQQLGMTEREYRSMYVKHGASKITPQRRKEIAAKAMKTKIARGSHKKIGYYYTYDWYGDTWNVQGYEPYILDVLQHDLKLAKDLVFIPNVQNQYLFEYQLDGSHIYYPDFVLNVGNGVILEIKSTWTYQRQVDAFYRKGISVVNSGYSFLPLIFRLFDYATVRGRWNDSNVQEWWSAGNSLREGLKSVLDWAISNQTSNPGAYWYDGGSTTILYRSTLKREEMAGISIKEIVI